MTSFFKCTLICFITKTNKNLGIIPTPTAAACFNMAADKHVSYGGYGYSKDWMPNPDECIPYMHTQR